MFKNWKHIALLLKNYKIFPLYGNIHSTFTGAGIQSSEVLGKTPASLSFYSLETFGNVRKITRNRFSCPVGSLSFAREIAQYIAQFLATKRKGQATQVAKVFAFSWKIKLFGTPESIEAFLSPAV